MALTYLDLLIGFDFRNLLPLNNILHNPMKNPKTISGNSLLYETDFKYLKNFPIVKSSLQKFNPCKLGNGIEFYDIFKGYCTRSTFHGMGRFADTSLPNKSNKITWLIIMVIVLIVLGYFLFQIQTAYEGRSIKIVVDPMVSSAVPNQFPAVMVCNKNRINWERFNNATKMFLPSNSSKETIELLKSFISSFNNASLSSWSVFTKFENTDLTAIESIDIDKILLYLSFDCDEFFVKCSWDSEEIPCCKIFIKQLTEAGNCFIFNTRINPENEVQARLLKPQNIFPWLITDLNGNGLEIFLKTNPNHFQSLDDDYDGITADILDENEWPSQKGSLIPINFRSELQIERKKYSSRDSIQKLPLKIRGCVFENDLVLTQEENKVIFDVKIHAHDKCRVHCTQRRIKKYCGCLTSVFLPPGTLDYPACTPNGYKCLGQNADNISYYIYNKKPHNHSILTSMKNVEFCQCYEYCSVTFDDGEFQSFRIAEESKEFNIVLKVFYYFEGVERYKSQINLSDLDYMVYYGGIISMFIGTSVMSMIEILFFTSMAISLAILKLKGKLLSEISSRKNKIFDSEQKSESKNSGRIFINVNPVQNRTGY